MGIHIHRGQPGWYYFAIGEWQPFKRFQHGGWFYLSWLWLRRFA